MAHDGPEQHAPGEQPVVDNGPGPQVTLDETNSEPTTDNSIASKFWPWKDKPQNTPPEFKPYRLPTMADDGHDYHDNPAPLVKAPAISPDSVFLAVMGCYPAPSTFNIDVELRGQLRSSPTDEDLFETTGRQQLRGHRGPYAVVELHRNGSRARSRI